MRRIESTTISGKSGTSYPMNRYPADMRFNDFIPGVFVLFSGDKALFAGQSDNVDAVLQSKNVASSLANQGFSTIGLVRNGSPGRRAEILADLEEILSPDLAEL